MRTFKHKSRTAKIALIFVAFACSDNHGNDVFGPATEPPSAAPRGIATHDTYTELVYRNLDGSDVRVIQTGRGCSPQPPVICERIFNRAEFSPNGTEIVFARGSTFDQHIGSWMRSDIVLINADGSNLRQLTQSRPPGNEIIDYPYADVDLYMNPTWSPDGRQIAYIHDAGEATSGELWIMNADGSGKTRIHDRVCLSSIHEPRILDWSPNGRWILFPGECNPTSLGFPVITPDGRQVSRTACPKAPSGCRRWSRGNFGGSLEWTPDGRLLMVSSTNRIFLVTPGTGDFTAIGSPEDFFVYATISGDGRTIAALQALDCGVNPCWPYRLHLIPVNGGSSTVRSCPPETYGCGDPIWRQ